MQHFAFTILLLQTFFFSLSSGFVAPSVVSSSPRHVTISKRSVEGLQETRIFSEVDDEQSGSSLTEEVGAAPEARPPRITISKGVQDVFLFLGEVYSFFLIFAGSLSVCGLLLNASGYGYQFTKDGFRVDTIEHMRMESQMKREYQRMGHEIKPPSSLPQ